MNCGQAIRLLPLWIGRDLADASESEALRAHLAECPNCASRHSEMQKSLEALQSVSTLALSVEAPGRTSLWPRLVMVLGEVPRRRDQFNGWIPAAAMALAASVMVGVSVVRFQRDMGDAGSTVFSEPPLSNRTEDRDLFRSDQRFAPHANRYDLRVPGLVKDRAGNW